MNQPAIYTDAKALIVPGPFDHVMEANRPTPTGETARNDAEIYYNPAIRENCVLDPKTGGLYSFTAWERVCDDRLRGGAWDMLLALEYLESVLAEQSEETFDRELIRIRAAIAATR